ncbi:MAG: zf-HC2 domain-containing protein [Spirochaetes bacterium]|nr:zf-HC2 domain-containing protein [Spirochaetota bacterium]
MNCDQVKMILADYLDGTATEKEKASVAAHLKKCDNCRDELRFLKKYLKAIGKYPTFQAPDDFLKGVHRGIERRQRSGIVRTLFFPLSVKVPLEAAALVALALTGVLLFRPYRTDLLDYGPEQAPAVTEHAAAPDRKATRDIAPGRRQALPENNVAAAPEKKRATRPEPARKDAAVTVGSRPGEQIQKQETADIQAAEITLALRLKSAHEEKAATEDLVTRESEDAAADSGIIVGGTSLRSSAAPEAQRAKTSGRDEQRADTIWAIDDLARPLGGKIIQTVMDKTTGAPRSVVVELPSGNYPAFIERLGQRWNIFDRSPAAPRASATLRITMHIQD